MKTHCLAYFMRHRLTQDRGNRTVGKRISAVSSRSLLITLVSRMIPTDESAELGSFTAGARE